MINYFEDNTDGTIIPFSKTLMVVPRFSSAQLRIYVRETAVLLDMKNPKQQLTNYKQWLQAQSPSIKELS